MSTTTYTLIFSWTFLIMMLMGCSDDHHCTDLNRAASLAEDFPGDALAILDSIDSSSLSECDRHYHDLLTIKAKDKAFIQHTSDSLILDVINWYSTHKKSGLYPEALYYGGTTYSDLGDYPSSIKYYQNALQNLEEDQNGNVKLKGNIHAQLAHVLKECRLYDEALHHINECQKIDSVLNDSINLIYDLQAEATVLLRLGNTHKAEHILKEAKYLCVGRNKKAIPIIDMYLASILMKKGMDESAAELISEVINKIDYNNKESAYAYATQIYSKANMHDSAFIYAEKLLNGKSQVNRVLALKTLLSEPLIAKIPKDSIDSLLHQYALIMNIELDKYAKEEVLIKTAIYNYDYIEKSRAKTLVEKAIVERNFFIITIVCLILGLICLSLILSKNRKFLNLFRSILILDLFNREDNKGKNAVRNKNSILINKINSDNLREELRNRILELRVKNHEIDLPYLLSSSEAFQKLRDYIKSNKILVDHDPLWSDLEKTILQISPDFKTRLEILTSNNLTKIDYQTCILVKCRVSPVEIARLLSKSKGAIGSRRSTIGKKIFDNNLSISEIDEFIKAL